ncbi:MAG: thiol-disulfide oxidoreductase DCC family protein, partial [Flavobacteriales bacterium]
LGSWMKRKKPKLSFYYDEECPLCAKTRMALQSLDLFGCVAFKGVQSHAHQDAALKDISTEKLLQDIHLTAEGGRVYIGVNAYIRCFFALAPTFPMAILLSIPGIKHFAAWVYRKIADSRNTSRCTDDTCGYYPPQPPADEDAIKISKRLTLGSIRMTAIKLGLFVLLILQLNSTYNSTAVQLFKEKIGVKHSGIEAKIQSLTEPWREFSKDFFGITGHTVFLDKHFNGYRHNIAVEYVGENGGPNIWLPIITPSGQPGDYQVGPTWARWTFRINGPNIQPAVLNKGVEDFTAYWMGKNHISFKHAKFKIWVKTFDAPDGWRANHLREQMAKPWIDAGEVEWNDKKFEARIADIEAIP